MHVPAHRVASTCRAEVAKVRTLGFVHISDVELRTPSFMLILGKGRLNKGPCHPLPCESENMGCIRKDSTP